MVGHYLLVFFCAVGRIIKQFFLNIREDIRELGFRTWVSQLKLNHWLLFPIVFLYFELILRIFNGTPIFYNCVYPILFAISTGLIASALTAVFNRKINRIISIVILAVFGLYFTVECVLKNTYQMYMDIFAIINGTGNVVGKFGGDVVNAILGAIVVIILFFLPLILYLLIGRKHVPSSRYHVLYGVMLLVCSFIIGGAGILFAANLPGTSGKYSAKFEYTTATQAFGLLTSTRLDIQYGLLGNSSAQQLVSTDKDEATEEEDTEETDAGSKYGYNEMDIDFDKLIKDTSNKDLVKMDEYVDGLEPSNKNEYTGLFEGKNLIMITAEAFSSQVINKELTPTLYRLANKGIKFTDFYQPAWGGSTTTGEYSILLGLVPVSGETSMMDTIGDNMYFTMGNQLRRQGYKSIAFHNGSYDYYNRDQTHKNLGFDDFLAWGNGLEDYLEEWSGDKETFEATLPIYDDDQPFYAYYMSYSGHCVYKKDDEKTKKNLKRVKEVLGKDNYKNTTLYYYCYQLELEYALESMVSTLEDKGIADDTVIVLCTDHYPYGLQESSTFGNDEDYLYDLYKTDDYDKFLQDKNSLIIWSESIEDMKLEVDTPTMSLDILPTLSNLFGLEYDSRLLVGRDVFSDAMPLVLWTNHSFLTEHGSYDADTDKYESFDDTADDKYFKEISTIVSNKISYSSQVVDNDYFGTLFDKDEDKDKNK